MAFVIKPLVTEKMTKITDQSSERKKFRARAKHLIESKDVTAEKISYVVSSKRRQKAGKADETREKTIYTYEKPALPKYGFLVRPEANKIEIKKEIESLYNVTVLSINTMKYSGKRSARYTKAGLVRGHKNAYKKAIVTLKEGDTIDFYSNI